MSRESIAVPAVGRAPERATGLDVAAVRGVLATGIQLGLVLLVAWEFQLETRTFFNVLVLSALAFPIHAALPLRWRLPFFVSLSVTAIGWVFGPAQGTLLIGTGLLLIGICHLPIRWSMRIGLLVATAGALAAARAGAVPSPIGAMVWPILASMFMFRLALYVHALRHESRTPTAAGTLAYFFMLPNLAFPLFPVIDYATFTRTHYDSEAAGIYRTGLHWIVRGLFHLLLYRYVYVSMSLDPATVSDLGDLVSFLLGTFLLYLRISGSFHIIVGLLHLFGFRLPETHHLYFLASSFTDFWRRINIYWKDFMMKLVYYPSFFRLRRHGNRVALVVATIVVFIATWILHSYQWFWLRGGFPLTAQDGLFWGVLGVLVVATALREMRRGRGRSEGRRRWSARLALRTVGTFSVICVLWSLWSAESVVEWLFIWRIAARADVADVFLLAGLLATGLLVGGFRWSSWGLSGAGSESERPRLFDPVVRSTALLVLMCGLTQTEVYGRVAPRLASAVATLQQPVLNARDEELQHRGYYEKLDNPGRMSAQLWSTVGVQPPEWQGPTDIELLRSHASFLWRDLHPNLRTTLNGDSVRTNRWGMRDRDYPIEKQAGTIRIALLGQSHVLGTFVAEHEMFETVLEERLNRESRGRPRYEILNFAVTNHSLTQELALLEDRVLDFDPDIVIVTIPSRGRFRSAEHLVSIVESGIAIPYDGLRAIAAEAGLLDDMATGVPIPFATVRTLLASVGVDTRMPHAEAHVRARDLSTRLTAWTLGRIAEVTRSRGIQPVLLALDNVIDPPRERIPELAMARETGFIVFDLLDIWEDGPQDSLRIADWDRHPNADGHRLIADRLHEELLRHRERLGLTLSSQAEGGEDGR